MLRQAMSEARDIASVRHLRKEFGNCEKAGVEFIAAGDNKRRGVRSNSEERRPLRADEVERKGG
jgi:hypothetical protein